MSNNFDIAKLPVEHPIREAVSIYLQRLGVYCVVVVASFLIWGGLLFFPKGLILLRSVIFSDWFVVGVIVWGIIAIANRVARNLVMETVGELITKPIIFQTDSDPGSVKLYARQLLETLAKLLTSGVFGISNRLIQIGRTSLKRNEDRFSKDETSLWKGISVIGLLINQISISSAVVVLYLFGVSNYLLWFGLDVVYRISLTGLYLWRFALLAPLDLILSHRIFFREELHPTSSNNSTTKNK
jgi:hypothetical protein